MAVSLVCCFNPEGVGMGWLEVVDGAVAVDDADEGGG